MFTFFAALIPTPTLIHGMNAAFGHFTTFSTRKSSNASSSLPTGPWGLYNKQTGKVAFYIAFSLFLCLCSLSFLLPTTGRTTLTLRSKKTPDTPHSIWTWCNWVKASQLLSHSQWPALSSLAPVNVQGRLCPHPHQHHLIVVSSLKA